MREVLDLLREKRNINGEIHLDSFQSETLLRFLESVTTAIEGYDGLLKNLQEIMRDEPKKKI